MATKKAPPAGSPAATPAATPIASFAPNTLGVAELHTQNMPAGAQQMDPRLQRASAMQSSRGARGASASTRSDELAVIAKVRDLQAWNAMSEVRPGMVLGKPGADGTVITTARIPLQRIQAVRAHPSVVSLKAAQRVSKALVATLSETASRPADLPKKSGVVGGRGVVVGVVDFGCDFVHANFRSARGKTRLQALWDQNQPAGAGLPGDPSYGRVWRSAQIATALKAADPYSSLGYAIEDAAHGTHVLDIAGGNGLGTGAPGMAPQADLVFVELAASDVPWAGRGTVGANFGDSVQLLEALKFIFDQAGSKPCVVNLSLGTNGGPHDGSTLVEQGIDRLVQAAPNRAVVIAASNSQGDGIHAMGVVPAAGTLDLKLTTQTSPRATEDECELWFAGASRLTVELIAPGGQRVARVAPGATVQVQNSAGQTVGLVANRLADPNNGDNTINVWWSARMPKGQWTLRLASAAGAVPFHAWLERNDSAQASFTSHRVDSHTLGTISCGQESIVVASYDAHKPGTPLSWFSSTGPTRDGRQKPEVSAPGHDVVAARSTSLNGSTAMSGTSMAAPATTGLVALVLARAKARKLKLNAAQIRQVVINSCRRAPPSGTAWDAAYGHGRISGQAAVVQLMGAAPPPVVAKPAKSKKPAAKQAVIEKVPVKASKG
jgi:subtilisin family serine protease